MTYILQKYVLVDPNAVFPSVTSLSPSPSLSDSVAGAGVTSVPIFKNEKPIEIEKEEEG